MRVQGAIDLHVHAGPDARPRKLSAAALARVALEVGLAGFALKRHHASTVAEAAVLRELFPGLLVFGGITLNRAVGGLNPEAVEQATRAGASIVWLPTCDAAHDRAFRGHSGEGVSLLGEDGRVSPAAAAVLSLVAEARVTLALGHISRREMMAVLAFGRKAGVARFLISHPEINILDLPVGFQRELQGPDVIFERCYVRANQTVTWDGLAQRIREVGVDSSALATDLGQPEGPEPPRGYAEMLEQLAERGFTDSDLEIMARRNPRRALGLE